jgi:hypothetical protein
MDLFQTAKSYNLSDVIVTVSGLRLGGFGEDGGVEVEFQGDISSMKQGADGETTVSLLPIPPAVVTITLMETSASNEVLMGLLVAQRNLPEGFVLPFAMVDPNTGETLLGGQVTFMNLPNISKGKEAGTREWKLGLPKPIISFAV